MQYPFEGKTAIVCGAGRGVGRAIAKKLVERGAEVMLADHDEARLQDARDDFEAHNGRVARFTCDISHKFGVNNLIAATLDAFDKIDALITTPTETERADLLTLDADALERVMAANLRSAFLLSKVVARKMIAQAEARDEPNRPAGAIVHVSSLAGRLASPEIAAYSISCAALDQLTRTLAVTLAPHRIRVNGVAPGGVMTETLKSAIATEPGLRPALLSNTPLGRIGEAWEAAEAALFLASDQASFVTGEIMVVDGGRSTLDPLAATAL